MRAHFRSSYAHGQFRLIGVVFTILGALFALMVAPSLLVLSADLAPRGDTYIVTFITALIGLPFLIVGIVFLRIGSRDARRRKTLMREGVAYDARILHAYYNMRVSINRRHPLVLSCMYTDAQGDTHRITSQNIWELPSANGVEGLRARVWVDPHRASHCHVELLDDAHDSAADPYVH